MGTDEEASPRGVEWATPASISSAPAAYMEVARLSGGTSLVMRRNVDSGNDVVTVTSQVPGSEPIGTELLRVPDLNCCASPLGGMRVKSDGRGGAHLIWMERLASAPYRRIHGRYYNETTGFGPQWSVVGVPGNAIRSFDLAVREDGTGLLGWIESTPDSPVTEALGPSLAFSTEIAPSGLTATPQVLSATIPIDQSGFFNVTTASSSSGYKMVLWTQLSFLATITELWGTVAAQNGAWQLPRRLSESPQVGGGTVGGFAGAIDESGNAVVAWEWSGSNPDIQRIDFASMTGLSAWSAPQVLSQPATNPVVALAEPNSGYVAFLDRTQSASIQNSIKLARIQGSRVASVDDVTPSQAQPYFVGRPSLAAMQNGTVILAWTATPRDNLPLPRVERRVLADGMTWRTTEQVSTPGSAATTLEPFALVGNSHATTLLWTQDLKMWFQVARPRE